MKSTTRLLLSLVCCLPASIALGRAAAAADVVADFYRDKKVALLIGAEAGGGTDVAGRLMAKHIGRFIPGSPNVVPQNMQGAGSLKLTNYLANVAAPDGLSFGVLVRGVIQQPILGDPAAKFDPLKLDWIGTISSGREDAYLLVLRKGRGVSTVEGLKGDANPIVLGSSGGNSTNMVFAKLSSELFGFNTRLIQGYQGSNSVMLGLQRGEVDGIYSTLMSLSNDSTFKSGTLIPVVQAGRATRHPNYPNVTLLRELVSKPDDVSLLSFVESVFLVTLPFAAPPNIPADRLTALRKAFLDTCADESFVADAKRLNMDISPLGGDDIKKVVAEMVETPPNVIERYKKMITP